MGPKTVNRAVKPCPKYEKQVPTATRECDCGHDFKKPPEPLPILESPHSDRKRRKSERTQRITVKPDFYSPSDYENPFKRRRQRTLSIPLTPTPAPVTLKEEDTKRKRGRPKTTPTKPSLNKVRLKEDKKNAAGDSGSTTSDKDSNSRDSRDKEEDMHSLVTPEKALQYAVILAEINNKFTSQVFRPT